MQNILLVVAKKPSPGQTKTRLCPPLDSEQAAELYKCFLWDTLAIMRSVPDVKSKIVYLPQDAHDYFRGLSPDMELIPQRGDSLGERLDNLLTDELVGGADKAVVINSDSPTLPKAYLSQAFDELAIADVVFGPSSDGGYYLVGIKEPQPHLLRNVKMSTPNVLQDTLELARNIGADLVVARSRFVTAMPDLIIQNIRTWDHEAIAKDCNQPISQLANEGLIAFNNGDYFEAHEHLEDAWNDDASASRDVYKAILQVAVAYLQIERQNYRGAVKMFIRARQWLQPLPNICRGIDIDRLRKDADEIYSMISELGPDRMDHFDFERLQPVSYLKSSFTESNNS